MTHEKSWPSWNMPELLGYLTYLVRCGYVNIRTRKSADGQWILVRFDEVT